MVKVVQKQQFQQALPCFPVPLPAQQFLDRHNIMFAAALEKVIKKLISQGAKNVTVKWVNRPSFPSDSENERARNFAFWIHAERDFEFFAPEDEV
jgi:hypothetical protein